MQSLAINEDAVLRFTVIVQSLAVVRKKENERPVVDSFRLEERKEVADDGVRACDLAVVLQAVAASIRLRWIVGRMRLVEMEKVKQRPLRMSADPPLCNLLGLPALSLHATDIRAAVRRVDQIVVLVEPAGDSGLVPEDERRDRGASAALSPIGSSATSIRRCLPRAGRSTTVS